MADENYKRKLVAILSADVEGYSYLMDDNEEATDRTLTTYRNVIKDFTGKYRGRVVDAPGDNILAEFSSVVDAVNCAVEIQRDLAQRNAELSYNRKMEFRIGINLGDVIEEDDRIYGDGVNIAARVESVSEAGGICISGRAYDQVENKLDLGYADIGKHQVKNIARPIQVFRVLSYSGAAAHSVVRAKERSGPKWHKIAIFAAVMVLIVSGLAVLQSYLRRPAVEPASVYKMTHLLPNKPSIAVLPFDNMSGNPEDEYIADGLAKDIITAISKIDAMFVIARNSTFAYKGKSVKIKQVSEDFGVQYVLEGSIQRAGDRLRVTAQLIDALTGHHIWADRYDRKMEDLFEIKDDITKKIVTELQVEITDGELARLGSKETNNFEAWIHFSKGRIYFSDFTKRENNIKAREHFEKAIKLEPDFATAHALLAATHGIDVGYGCSEDAAESFKQYYELTQKALSLDDSSAMAHESLGRVYRRQGQFEKAIAEGEKAIALEPSNAVLYLSLSVTMHFAGKPKKAIDLMKNAMRLRPIVPARWTQRLGLFLHSAGRYDMAIITYGEALERHKKTGEHNPIWILYGLTASNLEINQIDNAGEHFKEAVALSPPMNFIGWATVMLRYKDKDLERLKRLFEPLRRMYADADIKTVQYVHKEPPAIKFEYPEGSQDRPFKDPGQILFKRAPGGGGGLFSYVDDIPQGINLEDFGPKYYLPLLKGFGIGTKFDVISNELITLKNGTKAYKTNIKWLFKDGRSWVTTAVVAAYKGDKYVSLGTNSWGDPEDVAGILESLTFQ